VQNAAQARPGLPGLETEALSARTLPESSATRFDLDVSLEETFDAAGAPAGLTGRLIAAADVFDAGTAARLAGWLDRVLGTVAAAPGIPLSAVEILDGAERDRLVHDWNDTATDVPGTSVVALFEAQAERAPDAIAVIDGDVEVSYADLDARANRLAARLTARGAGPEAVVAVALERGAELLAAVLGVLKAGAAYLVLDPAQPAGRLAAILDDAEPPLAVTNDAGRASLQAFTGPVLYIGSRAVPAETGVRPEPVRGAHPAYVVYTSGSTGRPKGVVVTHAGLVNTVTAGRARFGTGPGSRVAQFASATFDNFCLEWSIALCSGAALVVVPEAARLGDGLAEFITGRRITHASLPPAVLAGLRPDTVPAQLVVEVGGEACPPELAARWSRGRVLFNTYGPTETTVDATCWRARPDAPDAPIGAPIANTRAYVLDDHLRPVPVGVTGEL
jgi:amino acid adenylation domain-containing protein